MKIEKFEDIECWKKWRELTNQIYKITNNEKFSKDRWLKDQIRRASVWIISNIAEGFERSYDKEFKQFLYIAKWSCGEVRAPAVYRVWPKIYLWKRIYNLDWLMYRNIQNDL